MRLTKMTHFNVWMVPFAISIATQKVPNAVIPTKDVVNAPKIIRLCAIIKIALAEQIIVVIWALVPATLVD